MFIEDWRYQFTLANNVCLLELMPPRWAPEGREFSYEVVIIDKFHCINDDINLCVIIWLFHYINQFKNAFFGVFCTKYMVFVLPMDC